MQQVLSPQLVFIRIISEQVQMRVVHNKHQGGHVNSGLFFTIGNPSREDKSHPHL
ncbi:hypothetical protein I79_003440 [Cricetulus griseus]|uniref:Uncharacterized protein n=1 Tax=Cricetulus griseus TaxID=10029 RepID=G3GZZ2_CRIGR|nr:hypothetical protein I79_003440 [Cricetulus griseus]